MWCALNTALLIILLAIVTLGLREYIRLSLHIAHIYTQAIKMTDCDELIDQMLNISLDNGETAGTADAQSGNAINATEQKQALVAGGSSKQYLGRQITISQLDEMSDEEIEKLYDRYEARLGATMTKTLGTSALRMYALAASAFLPIPPENQLKLVADLEEDPFVGHALTTACCELYYKYGMYLAPLTAALTTAKNCRFGHQCPPQHVQDVSTSARGSAGEGAPASSGEESDTTFKAC